MGKEPKYESPRKNLRLYLEQINLPPMLFMTTARTHPPIPQPGESLLSTTPDSRRQLRVITSLVSAPMRKRVSIFIHSFIPPKKTPIDTRYDRRMFFRARSFRTPTRADFGRNPPVRIDDMSSINWWLYKVVGTAQCAMEMVWPNILRRYTLTAASRGALGENPDRELYMTWFWSKNWGVTGYEEECKVIIAIVAPWAMGPEDMKLFCAAAKFPTFTVVKDDDNGDKLSPPPAFERVHKIWAKVWDDCMKKSCPFFVVTVYNTWFFGVFTRGWSTAMVSDPIPFNAAKPSVLHWLLFWFASAMGFRKTWTPPSLPEFANLDIKNAENIAPLLPVVVKQTGPRESLVEKNEKWLDKNLRERKGFARTTVVPNLPNTWMTSF